MAEPIIQPIPEKYGDIKDIMYSNESYRDMMRKKIIAEEKRCNLARLPFDRRCALMDLLEQQEYLWKTKGPSTLWSKMPPSTRDEELKKTYVEVKMNLKDYSDPKRFGSLADKKIHKKDGKEHIDVVYQRLYCKVRGCRFSIAQDAGWKAKFSPEEEEKSKK